MGRFIGMVFNTLVSVFVAQIMSGSVASPKVLTMRAIDSISRKILKQATWAMMGAAFLTTGVILVVLEVSALMGEPMGAFFITSTLVGKTLLILLGAACLYMGLAPAGEGLFAQESKQETSSVNWNEIIQSVVAKMTEPRVEPSNTARARELSDMEIDRIAASLRDMNADVGRRRVVDDYLHS